LEALRLNSIKGVKNLSLLPKPQDFFLKRKGGHIAPMAKQKHNVLISPSLFIERGMSTKVDRG
jgi:hypothetical protein